MKTEELVLKSNNRNDLISSSRTIYDAKPGEIFWKNFLAGLGRGLGGIFMYLVFLGFIGILFVNLVLPKVMPLINAYLNLAKTFESLQGGNPQTEKTFPNTGDIFKFLGQ